MLAVGALIALEARPSAHKWIKLVALNGFDACPRACASVRVSRCDDVCVSMIKSDQTSRSTQSTSASVGVYVCRSRLNG